MKDRTCPKCGSSDIIEGGRIVDYGNDAAKWWNLGVTVYAHPDAWIAKGATTSALTVRVCGACGYVELYVKHPEKLLEAYRQEHGPA